MVTRCGNTYGNNRGTTNEGDHTPVESKEAYSNTSEVSEKLVNNHIIWCNPAHPVENTESGEQVAGEPEPAETSENSQAKELLARDVLNVPLAVVFVQCAEQSTVHERTGPDHGPNQELTSHAGKSETNHLRGEAEHHLITYVPVLVEIDALSGDDIRSVNTFGCDVDHNSDEGVLFDVEGTRVQRDGVSEYLDVLGR